MRSFVREKRVTISDFQEVNLFNRNDFQDMAVKEPRKKQKVTQPKNQTFNDKKSANYFYLLAQQFKQGDFHITLTYNALFLPETPELAKKELDNFFRRLKSRLQKKNVPLKFLAVTEYKLDDEGNYTQRIHHHVLIKREATNKAKDNGVTLEDILACWMKGTRWKKKSMGIVETDIIQVLDETQGIEDLVKYLTKGNRHKKGQRIWTASRNLERPMEHPKRDRKFSMRKLAQMCLSNSLKEDLAKEYIEWDIFHCKAFYSEYDGWHVKLRMRKRKRKVKKK
ncbi:MAG: hypothetical protein LBV67_06060 [Streptococcaceae bacterium]|jgi:hypothetical protein|nr:hypothetical protein [Streptococcaceae bacterium]